MQGSNLNSQVMSELPVTSSDPEERPDLIRSSLDFPVVGIGASAGGMAALLRFFEHMPARSGMAFVVVLHLSPKHESSAPAILQRATRMPVTQVTKSTPIERDHVYVIPPSSDLLMNDGYLRLTEPARRKGPHVAIDLFFRALAEVHRERAICIVMSGTGAVGSVGLARIKEEGGVTMVQTPADAEHDSMPQAAIATGMVDFVLPAVELPQKLLDLWRNARHIQMPADVVPELKTKAPDSAAAAEQAEIALGDIMEVLRKYSKNDFRHYKRATVLRRIERRLQIRSLPDIPAYRDYLREHPEEAKPLLQDMLISVTNFFRDREAFEALEREVMPQLFDQSRAATPVRVWVTGCATGEEAYSLAMLLTEQAHNKKMAADFQVFGTDIDDRAIGTARTGAYPSAIVTDVTPTRLQQFFTLEQGRYRVVKGLRETVLFANHNLLRDPPFSRVDLICCRNLLIYLDREAQSRILELFRFALKPGGYLFLGVSESADAAPNLFTVVDKKARIFRVNPLAHAARHLPTLSESSRGATEPDSGRARALESRPSVGQLHRECLLEFAPPSVLVDAKYEVLHLSDDVGQFLQHQGGTPSRNLLASVQQGLRVELRTVLFQATYTGKPVVSRAVPLLQGEKQQLLKIHAKPFPDGPGGQSLILVAFEKVDDDVPYHLPTGESPDQLVIAQLEEEVRKLKEYLQNTIEQSDTSAEELKASNEELQAINEELRSATEELETSKEELQSVNEELITVNFDLKTKVEETARINDDLQNFIVASDIPTVFIDGAMRIKRYTPQAVDIFNLIPSDIDRPLLDVKDKLNYQSLAQDAEKAFQSLQTVERTIQTAEGKHYLARIRPYRTSDDRIEGAVLTFVDVTALRRAEEAVRTGEERLRMAAESTRDYAIITTDETGRITTWNAGAARVFGYSTEEIIGESLDILFTPEDRAVGAPQAERITALTEGRAEDERWHRRKDGTRFYCSGIMTPLQGEVKGFAKIARDLTGNKEQEVLREALLQKEKVNSSQARAANELKDKFLAVMSHELKHPLNLIQVSAELLINQPEVKALPSVRRAWETISLAVASQTKIIDDLLDLSRARTGKLTLKLGPVNFGELLATIVEAASAGAAQKGVSITLQKEEGLEILCDRVRTEQICWNLINNAVKFTSQGGLVEVSLQREGGFARLSVVDTGRGIDPEFLPHVFGMFSQGEDAQFQTSGLGVGLALVQELAAAQGGRVLAESEGLGRGAAFSVWLPLREEKANIPTRRKDAKEPRALTGLRILAVDDMLDALEPFAELLRIDGATVDTADTGEKALQLLASSSYDLLISDLGMAGMDGLALIGEVRKRSSLRDLPAIALSGYGRQADVAHALEHGFNAHLSKPASLASVRQTIANLKRPAS